MFYRKCKSSDDHQSLTPETIEIIRRLNARCTLLDTARNNELKLCPKAAVALQGHVGKTAQAETAENLPTSESAPEDILEAVQYRLAITDLFVEKAQYHLEERATRYERHGKTLYSLAIGLFCIGTLLAVLRMFGVLEASGHITTSQPVLNSIQMEWIKLLKGFIVTFTAYGFIVLTAVALTRGARACLDQRERLLAKRHSLRQGRLYLHLGGGRASIEDMERAFNWNHEQHNAFTNMPTDAKAPWGNVIEEIVKIVPELVKAGAEAAEKKSAPAGSH